MCKYYIFAKIPPNIKCYFNIRVVIIYTIYYRYFLHKSIIEQGLSPAVKQPSFNSDLSGKYLLQLPGYILKPFKTLIMPVNYRYLPEFIQTKYKIHYHRRQLKYKGT